MRGIEKILIAVIFIFIFHISVPSAHAEEIRSFDADISIQQNGTISVSETIRYDFGNIDRHGIFRTIPFVKTNTDGKKLKLSITSLKVADDQNTPHPFQTSEEGENLSVKIGDPDTFVSGVITYVISYEVSGALTYFSNHDELYWNVTGNGWNVPILSSTASVTLPQTVNTDDLTLDCYTGPLGSTERNCSITYSLGEVRSSVSSLLPQEGFTLSIGFPKGVVAVLEPVEYTPFFQSLPGKVVIMLFVIGLFLWNILLPLYLVYRWYKYGRDPKASQVRAWYDPPKTKDGRLLTPAESGFLIDEFLNTKDISATIVDLARRGYFVIDERKKKDFYLTKTTNPKRGDTLEPFEEKLLDKLFENGTDVRVKDLELVTTFKKLEAEVNKNSVSQGFFDKNPQSTRTKYYILSGLGVITGNILLAAVAFAFGRAMPKKTLFGAEQAAISMSLKNFLSGQQRQLTFQAKNQMMFEKLLPFAVAFGVEKIWASQFENTMLTKPDWYSSYDTRSRFNSLYLTNSLHSAFTSMNASMTPTRSSSGFSSGSSGGFSGGGGGGGGGGSW